MTKFEKIIIITVCALALVVLISGAIIFRQLKDINARTGGASGAIQQPVSQDSIKKKNPPLEEIIKQFTGTIEKISENELTVDVELADFSKPKNSEKSTNANSPQDQSANDFEKFNKQITVKISGETMFALKRFSDLKTGDAISVISDKSPYSESVLTAGNIIYLSPAR
ncbi:MAG: hypothetical protein UX02_C0002G0077 [Candidatus Moranbacteria bacterium GW2011_GWC1_45_18]|nr:MAG: hypothetical protein UT79_C0001G0384 [Candidatus Moranbacteria bacterium GW2011_GWC2_40_12]KKT32115.1 MAG: hypothetical protein UW19_C0031G0004 [Candidatus Moranbacteria bacterium GW2011_GWF2_44_10]KKT99758.1 MAG: hypothetical protein UX02_C0002G0077 [Candidatus Moranbacteria bacterium GW2011_GWC1_45_18]OGI39502.1 MAG: hypothetical protein A2374_03185 [Candidatus Moranbacteria bacterium RIFOXYB1_FULL_44_23]OGI42825.1 MAG: hypothetical protein A2593_00665 [Candidatus Moranbacteria bacter